MGRDEHTGEVVVGAEGGTGLPHEIAPPPKPDTEGGTEDEVVFGVEPN